MKKPKCKTKTKANTRRVVTGSKAAPSGYHPSMKSKALVPWESAPERDALQRFEFDPAIKAFRAHQTEITVEGPDGTFKTYPDIEIETTDGDIKIVEVKPEHRAKQPEVAARLEATRQHYADQGLEYFVLTERELCADGADRQINELMEFRKPGERARLLRMPRSHGGASLAAPGDSGGTGRGARELAHRQGSHRQRHPGHQYLQPPRPAPAGQAALGGHPMYLFRPVRGLKCRDEQNRLWQLDRSVFSNRLQFSDEDGAVQSLSYNDFHKRWLAGQWTVDPSGPALALPGFYEVNRPTLADYPPAQQAKIAYRFKVIEELLTREVWTSKELAAHCKKFPSPTNEEAPSVRSVRRWLAAYRQRRDVTALADQSQARRGSIDGALLGILEEAIDTVLLTRNRKKKLDAYDEVVALIKNKNRGVSDESLQVRIPSRAAVYRVLREIDNYAADKRRLGSAEANNRNRTALATLRPKRNLERVELDHMLLDIILVDDRTGLALGRPWLTVAIDCNSRLIVGLHLSFDSPCANSVLQCIKSGILPKDQVLARFPDISAPWPAYGIWHKLVLDNGKEMHSDRLKRAALELGICLAYCPSRKPWYKGHVERFNRTLNDGLIHSLPGTTFSNPTHRAGYPSKAMACIGFRRFEQILYRWILEAYHRRPHRSLRCSPLQRWTHCEEISAHILPAVPAELRPAHGQREEQAGVPLRHRPRLDPLQLYRPAGRRPTFEAVRGRQGQGTENGCAVSRSHGRLRRCAGSDDQHLCPRRVGGSRVHHRSRSRLPSRAPASNDLRQGHLVDVCRPPRRSPQDGEGRRGKRSPHTAPAADGEEACREGHESPGAPGHA